MSEANEHPNERELFAANLRAARKKRGISQEQLGHDCGLHPTAIARLETANRDPRLATIARIARTLKIPASDLVKGI